MEQQIKLAAKLYECRDTAKRFLGDKYEERLKPYKNIIAKHQEKYGLEILPIVYEICSFESVRDDGMMVMLFMAAAVEIIESEKTI